jgi:hypothetical protein
MHGRVIAAAKTFVLVASVGGLVAACSGASYADRLAYLKRMANEGVQTHRLLASQGAISTETRCTAAYKGLQDFEPPDDTGAGPSPEWLDQVQAFFVQSCVSGLPKAVSGQLTNPAPDASPHAARS